MSRGFKLDRAETANAYERGQYVDKRKRSFVGRASDGSLHDLLFGEDKSRRRREVIEKFRGVCSGCKTGHYIGALGEWHHRWRPGHVPRCDCIASAMWVCNSWHVRYTMARKHSEVTSCPGR